MPKRYSTSWSGPRNKRFAKRTRKGTDTTGTTAATTIDNNAPHRHTMTTRAVDSLITRANNPRQPLTTRQQRLLHNLKEWRQTHTHLDTYVITTMTTHEIRQLDAIRPKRTR